MLVTRATRSSWLLLFVACACGPSESHDAHDARALVRDLRAHYPLLFGQHDESRGNAGPAWQLALPDTAAGTLRLESAESDVALSVALEGARGVKANVVAGYRVYPGGGPGGSSLVHEVSATGSEDYVWFERPPEHARVIYQLALSAGVAGLRLVEHTLEALDALGAPRLRVNAPFLVDARGLRRDAELELVGCAADRSPKPPWRRTPVAPGASHCELRVSWNDAGLEYPIVLDPAWKVTAEMSVERALHSGIMLSNGLALVAGGSTGSTTLASAELYDFGTKTWAATASMSDARRNFTLTSLGKDRVIAIGGNDDAGELATAEIYDSSQGTWKRTANMAESRARHTTTVISDDVLLVAGGKARRDSLASAELYTLSTGAWSNAASMLAPEAEHSATLTSSGQVLVIGPTPPAAQLYDPSMNRWFPASQPAFARRRHSATVLSNSTRVLIVGGIGHDGDVLAAAEIYDASIDSWTRTGSSIVGHERHSAARMSDGRVIVVGDSDPAHAAIAESYDETWGTWAPLPNTPSTEGSFGQVAVTSGTTLLIAGGQSPTSGRALRDATELDARRTATSVTEYKLPAAVDPDVLADTPTELWAAVYRPSTLASGKRYPLLIFVHGNHYTCGPVCDPSVPACCEYTWSGTCSGGLTPVPSHRGFGYIAEELASRDFIVVSINSNRGISCGASATDFSARSAQVLKHLQQLSEWNRGVSATPSSIGTSLQGALDLSRVGLFGHSRGGDAVRAAYQDYLAAGSPWPERIVDPVTFRGIFEIAPTDDHPVVGANDNLQWNTLLPMCDGDVGRLDGVRVFDRSLLERSEANPTRKSALMVWGANHNFYNTEWIATEGSHCLGHRALFSDTDTGSAEQRQTAFYPALAFFAASVQPSPDPVLGRLFDSQYSSLADPRTDRAQIPAANSQYSLPLMDFSATGGSNANQASNVTVNYVSAPVTIGMVLNDPSLGVAAVSWRTPGNQTYFQTNWGAAGSGIDLSGFERVEFRIDRLKNSLNIDPTTNFSVQLANSDGSLSDKLPIGAYATLDGPVGAILSTGASRPRPWLPTASIPLNAFAGAHLTSIRGLRLTFDATATGLVRLASIRASRPVSSPGNLAANARVAQSLAVSMASTAAPSEPIAAPMGDQPGPASDAVRHASGNSIESVSARGAGAVKLTLTSATHFSARDEYLALLVGGVLVSIDSVHPGGDLSKVEFTLTRTDFDAAADGAEVAVQYGRGAADEVWQFGSLSKAALKP